MIVIVVVILFPPPTLPPCKVAPHTNTYKTQLLRARIASLLIVITRALRVGISGRRFILGLAGWLFVDGGGDTLLCVLRVVEIDR